MTSYLNFAISAFCLNNWEKKDLTFKSWKTLLKKFILTFSDKTLPVIPNLIILWTGLLIRKINTIPNHYF